MTEPEGVRVWGGGGGQAIAGSPESRLDCKVADPLRHFAPRVAVRHPPDQVLQSQSDANGTSNDECLRRKGFGQRWCRAVAPIEKACLALVFETLSIAQMRGCL